MLGQSLSLPNIDGVLWLGAKLTVKGKESVSKPELIKDCIRKYHDPVLGGSIITAHSVEILDTEIQIIINVGLPLGQYQNELSSNILAHLTQHVGAKNYQISFESNVQAHAIQSGLAPLAGVKNVIAVASGKGGVGKSTCSVNLAYALALAGAQVGILDADIYGPSVPLMLGLQGQQPETKDGKQLTPLLRHGVQAMSIGFLVDTNAPMVWRGPMVTSALQQLAKDTLWQELDYLIIDLPPGTGDIQLTLAQKIPVAGAVLVTTPQDIALLDVRRAIGMFEKVKVPVLGIIENMSTHVCSSCGHEEAIFGTGGAQQLADEFGVPVLGNIPLALKVREQADQGAPIVVQSPTDKISQRYQQMALKLGANLARQSRNYAAKFPKIVVEAG